MSCLQVGSLDAKTEEGFNSILPIVSFCPISEQFPLRQENLKKIGRNFPVREKLGNFEQTGKVTENRTKYWKIQGISDKYYLLFLVTFK